MGNEQESTPEVNTKKTGTVSFLSWLLPVLLVAGIILVAGISFAGRALYEKIRPIPETTSLLKIGFTTDWEYGSRKKLLHKLPLQGLPELKKVVTYYNDIFQPDIVIGGGDYIESSTTKPEKAKAQLTEINAVAKEIQAPMLYALGNHDMRSLSKEEVKSILGITESHAMRDMGDWRLIVIDTNFNKADDSDRKAQNYVLGHVSQAELHWLEEQLKTDRPTLVFSHHSPIATLSGQDTESAGENITNALELRAVLERAPNLVGVISGHTPRPQYKEVNGVHYFIADTLVNVDGLGAFATIEARYTLPSKRADILFEHYGLNRQTYKATKTLPE